MYSTTVVEYIELDESNVFYYILIQCILLLIQCILLLIESVNE